MFFPESHIRAFVYTRPVDMRKSFDGLCALTKHVLRENPLSGNLFVFINRRGNYIKVLYWDRTGFCLWAKRLEQGSFVVARSEEKLAMSLTQLKLMLEGIELKDVTKRKRFKLKEAA